jgi:hypothetical protein
MVCALRPSLRLVLLLAYALVVQAWVVTQVHARGLDGVAICLGTGGGSYAPDKQTGHAHHSDDGCCFFATPAVPLRSITAVVPTATGTQPRAIDDGAVFPVARLGATSARGPPRG